MIKFVFFLTLMWPQSVSALDCAKPVSVIREGDRAICTGYLFSPDAESEAFKTKKLYELQSQEVDILTKRLDIYTKELNRDNENLYRILYFTVGAVLTGYIAKNVR